MLLLEEQPVIYTLDFKLVLNAGVVILTEARVQAQDAQVLVMVQNVVGHGKIRFILSLLWTPAKVSFLCVFVIFVFFSSSHVSRLNYQFLILSQRLENIDQHVSRRAMFFF